MFLLKTIRQFYLMSATLSGTELNDNSKMPSQICWVLFIIIYMFTIYVLYLNMRTGLYILLKPFNEMGDLGSMGILQVD